MDTLCYYTEVSNLNNTDIFQLVDDLLGLVLDGDHVSDLFGHVVQPVAGDETVGLPGLGPVQGHADVRHVDRGDVERAGGNCRERELKSNKFFLLRRI